MRSEKILFKAPYVEKGCEIIRKELTCSIEERSAEACIEIYDPVCGQVQVECVTTPCNPVKETFSNSCFACMNERVLSYEKGQC